MNKFKHIEETLAEKDIDTNEHIWHELANTTTEFGPGWHSLIIELIGKIDVIYKESNQDITEFKIDQIKEKYGRLSVYIQSNLEEVHHLALEFENRSEVVCEECGEEGSLHVKNGYLLTLCETCASQMGYE